MKKNPRILHIGSNIANNVYLNALFLRENGFSADAISPNYDHPISTPEWERAEISSENIPHILKTHKIMGIDPNFTRPSWYQAGPLAEIAKNFGYISKTSNFGMADKYLKKVLAIVGLLNKYLKYMSVNEFIYFGQLISTFKKVFPNRKDRLSYEDIIPYISEIRALKHIFKQYDIIQAYSIAPIHVMLANKRPYIAFEHGTIREMPFENSPQSRLTALAYHLADHVFITNNDNNIAAQRLGINNYSPIPHPIDDYWFRKAPKKPGLKTKITTIFCPTRHDWSIKGLNQFILAIPEVAIKSRRKFEFVFIKWGNDYKKSQKLCTRLRIDKHIRWTEMLTKKDLVQKMLESDIILDQVILPCMGAIAPEGLQAGKPVLLSYKDELNNWAYPESPPLIKVYSKDNISKALFDLINNPLKAKKIGQKSKKWFNKYHSKEVIVKKTLEVYRKLI
ncbi:MAG: group 1 glycosyl transferase [Candidatus Berkelbacteria bacterium]|nr:group 1 glycosyl transferase [Candidatus Berkelbacteria bacterium]